MNASNSLYFSLIRYGAAWVGVLASFVFSVLWTWDSAEAWLSCYATAVAFSCLFLWTHRRNLISLSGIFVGLSLIAITLPAVPYLVFDVESVSSLHASIFLNSLGQLYFLTLALFFVPSRSVHRADSLLFRGSRWANFTRVNGLICLITLPLVLLAITKAGAWGYLQGDRSGDFDRIASMKGLGPLMIFSVINILALFFWASGTWLRGQRWRAFMVVALILFLNGFTGSRQNYIAFFFGAAFIYIALNGFGRKVFLFLPIVGLVIVLMKILRAGSSDSVSEWPWYVMLFLHFAGDFDSLNNGSVLIDYARQHGFFGLYHIWSNILVYVPRELFPSKSHDLGTLYLNTYLFPGVYLGAEGGTGLALGFQGLWYAVYGLPTLLLGNLLLALSLSWADRSVYVKLHKDAPGLFLVAYIFLIGQSIITYRDGFFSFLNTFLYVGIYYVFYIFIQSVTKRHATISSPRPLEPT